MRPARALTPQRLLEYLPAAVAWIGALTAVGIQLFSTAASSDAVWTIALAVVVLLGWLVGCVTVPTCGRGAPEIILTPDAVWVWTGGRRRACIPWAARPNLEASIIHRMRPHVMITGAAGGPVLFPIVVVPIGHAQLQTVLRFYTTHAELRGELATGQGLQRVRAFMAAPDLVGEGVGDAVVPEQVRGGGPEQVRGGSVLPAPEPTRPIDASPSPVSPYGGAPYQDTPNGGAPYATPPHGAVGAQTAVPEPAAPFGSAVTRPPTPPAAIGYGHGDGLPPSETFGMRQEADDPRRDDSSRSSKPVSCGRRTEKRAVPPGAS